MRRATSLIHTSDELSNQLGSARVGCTVGNMVVNQLMFSHDTCVLSGTGISGLQCLPYICDEYAAKHEIAFNYDKPIGVFFALKSINNLLHQMFFLNGVYCTCTIFDQVKYLGVLLNASLKDDDVIQRK